MGTPLRQIVYDIGGGIPKKRKFKAVQLGGPSGGCVPEEHLDTPVDFEAIARVGAIMGSGGAIVIDMRTLETGPAVVRPPTRACGLDIDLLALRLLHLAATLEDLPGTPRSIRIVHIPKNTNHRPFIIAPPQYPVWSKGIRSKTLITVHCRIRKNTGSLRVLQ